MTETNAIHVWRTKLDGDPAAGQSWETWLAPDEKARAARFVFHRDRHRFIAARGILRAILGQYLRRHPADIEFIYGTNGKPALRSDESQSVIHFNLSHSHGLAVYAFADRREVGIDVEAVRPKVPLDGVAEIAFSEGELAELAALPAELRDKGFFLCWTRKEAYMKARGAGLAIPPQSFQVSLSLDKPEILRSDHTSRWSFRSFQPAPGYVGAVVSEGRDWELKLWNWTDWPAQS
ncbi:MAG: 4'-phosphopantetheinyl transferase superfamily protein [Nitrospira sp.]|nr:4'-phosphopantetheinyl transferase superfamily protein [Nitrospira sp.]